MPVIINEVTVTGDAPSQSNAQPQRPSPAPTAYDMRELLRQQAERLARVTPE
jgi:hypothetical protein